MRIFRLPFTIHISSVIDAFLRLLPSLPSLPPSSPLWFDDGTLWIGRERRRRRAEPWGWGVLLLAVSRWKRLFRRRLRLCEARTSPSLPLHQSPALLAGFVLFKTCKFFRNKEQKWQFFPQIKNIWLHFSLWHSLPQAHKLLLNLSISSWVWVVRSYNLNSPYKSSENVREVEFVGQQYKLYQLH